MKIYNDICTNADSKTLNTGASEQCLESVTVMAFIAKDGFAFASVAEFKTKAAWDAAITAKDVVPLYEMYEVTPANTDATYFESRNWRHRTSKATKITNWEAYLGLCSHAALKSYENSEYTRIFEVTEDGDIIGVYDSDNTGVRGQLLKQFDVGIRTIATTEKNAYTPVTMTYDDHEELEKWGVIVTPDFNPITSLEGVFEVTINQSGAGSGTLITFTAFVGCTGKVATGLETELALLDGLGADQGATIAHIGNGTYTATGTGFVDGTISTEGVKVLASYGNIKAEGSAAVVAS
jgi:hypothetical protein